MISRLLAVSLVSCITVACGSHPPPPRDLPTLSDAPGDARTAAGDPAPDPAAASTTPATPKPAGLSPELIAAVGIKQLVINPFASLRMTAAERLGAQKRIAAWASAAGLLIIPPETVEAAIDRAAAGRDPNTGKACGPALDRSYAMERWIVPMGAAGTITARVDCDAQCTLQLEIELFGQGTEFYAAPFDPGQRWQDELERRLPQVIDIGGHERFGHGNNPVGLTGIPRQKGAMDWYLDPSSAIEDRRADAEASACGMTDEQVGLLLDIAPGGGVRCERAAIQGFITEYDAKVNACMCAVAQKHEHARPERSYVAYASPLRPVDKQTRNGLGISASLIGGNEYRPAGTAPWFRRGQESIADCFVARTEEVAPAEAAATLGFDANGAVTKAIIGDPTGLFRPDERACIMKKLKTIVTPCPRTSAPEGTVRIALEIYKPSAAK